MEKLQLFTHVLVNAPHEGRIKPLLWFHPQSDPPNLPVDSTQTSNLGESLSMLCEDD